MTTGSRFPLLCTSTSVSFVVMRVWSLRPSTNTVVASPRRFDPRLPIPPGRMQREIEAAMRSPERRSVCIELYGVALALLVEKLLDLCSLVAAGLVVDHPARAIVVPNQPVDHEGAIACS